MSVRLTRSTVNNNEANAAGMILSTGPATAQGGGVHAVRVVATSTSFLGNTLSAFSEVNQATAGGGAIYAAKTSSLTDVRVRSSKIDAQGGANTFAGGAGIQFAGGSSTYSIVGSTISGNQANALASNTASAWGGAVLANGRLTVTRSTLSRNTLDAHASAGDALASGGGIRAGGPLTLDRSTVSGNAGKSDATTMGATAQGGGVAIASGPGNVNRVVNSTVTQNAVRADASLLGASSIAIAEGGGIYVQLSPTRLTNTTVARNTAVGQGHFPFIRGGGTLVDSSGLTLRNSIVALNASAVAPNCGGPTASLGYNLIGMAAGCPLVPKPSDKTNKAAKLGSFGRHGGPTATIPLLKGSPALNAIPRAACTVKSDQRGVKRPLEKKCEIGAWERRP
jgi:predicted outer membrane repeat protein